MEALQAILALFGVTPKVLGAGAIGGGISAWRFFPDRTRAERFWIAMGGIAVACLFTDAIIAGFGLKAEIYQIAVAGGLGLCGLAILDAAISTLREVQWAQLLTNFIKKFTNGGTP